MAAGGRGVATASSPSAVSQLGFSWVTPLISLGARRQLQHGDLLALPPELQTEHCRKLMWHQWHLACLCLLVLSFLIIFLSPILIFSCCGSQ